MSNTLFSFEYVASKALCGALSTEYPHGRWTVRYKEFFAYGHSYEDALMNLVMMFYSIINKVEALADDMEKHADDYPIDEDQKATYRTLNVCAAHIREVIVGDS